MEITFENVLHRIADTIAEFSDGPVGCTFNKPDAAIITFELNNGEYELKIERQNRTRRSYYQDPNMPCGEQVLPGTDGECILGIPNKNDK
jgi:hypothetical protein